MKNKTDEFFYLIELVKVGLYVFIALSIANIAWTLQDTEPYIIVEAMPIVDTEARVPVYLEEPSVPEEPIVESVEDEIWDDSLEYLAMCVEAEAGNQTELGKRLVCDVVLNRYDSGEYDTLYDVINEEHNGIYQFSVVQDGRIFEVTPAEATYRIVAEELESRTNSEVLYFRTKYYHTFGTPLFQEDDHYFSK